MSGRSSHRSSGKGKSSSRNKNDDWSEISDPEERRRVQNRIAQRKFRDKAKESKERQERDAENRAHASHSYQIPEPTDMGPEEELSGLPWGSISMRHVVTKGRAREEESRRGSRTDHHSPYSPYETRSQDSQEQVYDEQDAYYEPDPAYYESDDRAYYDYGSSGHGGGEQ